MSGRLAHLATPLDRQIARFDRRAQGALREAAHERVAQLATTFPVLFYALATGYGAKTARQRALDLAVEGRPVVEVATAVGMPLCFRRLPPEACDGSQLVVSWSEASSRLLGSLIPRKPAAAELAESH